MGLGANLCVSDSESCEAAGGYLLQLAPGMRINRWVGFALDLSFGSLGRLDRETTRSSLHLGPTFYVGVPMDRVEPYLLVGVAYSRVQTLVDFGLETERHRWSAGFTANLGAGVFARLDERFDLGLSLAYRPHGEGTTCRDREDPDFDVCEVTDDFNDQFQAALVLRMTLDRDAL